ncbi:response regulator transcription factor [Roseiconus lacunae]|uniref:response regulator n=1 Tax=Roseiconus lacunae TaxID=2605694 RepID=UPI00308C3562|nr:response regulator transcription factor [Stieleria sp. HD01]
MAPIRFLVLDDHQLIRLGVRAAIDQHDHWEIAVTAATLAEGMRALEETPFDFAIVDLGLPDGSGLEFIAQARFLRPDVKILVSSMRDAHLFAHRCIAQGAHGYIAKQETDVNIDRAIQTILDGEIYLSPSLEPCENNGAPQSTTGIMFQEISKLSKRELSVFELIGQGYSTKLISEQMGVKTKTVDSYRERIKNKLELSSTSELLHYATRWIVSIEES